MIFSAGKFNIKKQFGLFYTAFRKKHIVILLACLLLMVVMSLLFIFFNQAIYKDVANCYAWNAREYSRGFWNHDLMQNVSKQGNGK